MSFLTACSYPADQSMAFGRLPSWHTQNRATPPDWWFSRIFEDARLLRLSF
jgi:hypothetical protein